MSRHVFAILALIASCVACAADSAAVRVTDGYVRGLPPGVANTAAYMTLQNTSDKTISLVGGSTDVADHVSIHATVNTDGMMSMEHRMSLAIPAGGEVVLKTGGLHLMLMGLKGPLPERVAMTLAFSNGASMEVMLPVISILDE